MSCATAKRQPQQQPPCRICWPDGSDEQATFVRLVECKGRAMAEVWRTCWLSHETPGDLKIVVPLAWLQFLGPAPAEVASQKKGQNA